ncbi:uncharacterized protein M421DRAFT_270762 [Didymella exigua CBS 183.55]|uniref:Uncharacterized protein n=1 Tax=Didymella exigua CBS 183.55 TaxID=1150837 RepID=A0A6A5RB77_9PLEO|nr:uncharacterized protein M421DRAFT_270762 [Didymella exigua CBS 183.55]KAF1924783.1 hypothetical protein M421DRAFT_270762 [Didymella exigua CBS 183.55]
MANRGNDQKGAGSPPSKELLVHVTSTSHSPPDGTTEAGTFVPDLLTNDNSEVKTYLPSPPPGGSAKIGTYIASLNTEQRNSIIQFIQATKEPTSVAIQTLIECEWDLIEAVSRFGDDYDDAQEDFEKEIVTPPTRFSGSEHSSRNVQTPPRQPKKDKRKSRSPVPLRRDLLHKLAFQNGQDWPQNPRNAAYEAIILQYSPSSPSMQTIPMFLSPYEDKMWYTGFMRP